MRWIEAYLLPPPPLRCSSARRLSDGHTQLVGESGTVTSIALSRCGRLLATNLTDSNVNLWQLPPGLADAGDPCSALSHNTACGNGTAGTNGSGGGSAGIASTALPQAPPPLHLLPYLVPGADPFDQLPAEPVLNFRMGEARPSRFVLR